jgi:hypothetical protein
MFRIHIHASAIEVVDWIRADQHAALEEIFVALVQLNIFSNIIKQTLKI